MTQKRIGPRREPIDFQSPELLRLAGQVAERFPDGAEQSARFAVEPDLLLEVKESNALDSEIMRLEQPVKFSAKCLDMREPSGPPHSQDDSGAAAEAGDLFCSEDLVVRESYSTARSAVVLPDLTLPELDQRLADQKVSLRHFSLATRKYMIRFQERRSDFKIEDFSAEIGINKSYYYKILNCDRRPSRDMAIAMAVCLRLTEAEAQDYLLLLGEKLNRDIKRDYLILECIKFGYSVDQTDAILLHFGSSPLINH